MAKLSHHKLAAIQQIRAHSSDLNYKAKLRNIFYSQDNESIRAIVKNDLQGFMDSYDISKLRLVTLDDFVKTFLQKISLVHKSPVIFKMDKENKDSKRLMNLLEEVAIQKVLSDTEMRMKLHNTILCGVKYFKQLDKMFIENSYDAGSTTVVPFAGFETEERFVIRQRVDAAGDDEFIIWDRLNETNYRTKNEPKYDYKSEDIIEQKLNIDNDNKFTGEKSLYPFVKYQSADQGMDFWQNGMDSLIELVRTVNVLLSIVTDDSISESLRILLMNFVPLGIDGKPGEFKVGMRNPLVAQMPPGEDASAQILSAELYVDEILQLVEALIDQLSSMHGIDSPLSKDITSDVSATSALLKSAHMLQTWQVDISVLRPYDMELIKKLVEVNNFSRPESQINTAILDDLTIDYQTPNIAIHNSEEYLLERQRWEDGTSSVLLYVQRRNPEFSKKEAEEYIKNNLEKNEELLAVTVPEVDETGFNEVV